MKDYKFSQVLLDSQEIKSVVRVVADRIFKMMSRKVEKIFEEKWFCIHFSNLILKCNLNLHVNFYLNLGAIVRNHVYPCCKGKNLSSSLVLKSDFYQRSVREPLIVNLFVSPLLSNSCSIF